MFRSGGAKQRFPVAHRSDSFVRVQLLKPSCKCYKTMLLDFFYGVQEYVNSPRHKHSDSLGKFDQGDD